MKKLYHTIKEHFIYLIEIIIYYIFKFPKIEDMQEHDKVNLIKQQALI